MSLFFILKKYFQVIVVNQKTLHIFVDTMLKDKYMEWREAANYEVSENGDVRKRFSDGELFYYKKVENDGYYKVGAYGVHQLVAMAFLGHEPDRLNKVVHHKDGNRKNNHYTNLEVISQSENMLYRNEEKTSIFPYVTYDAKISRYKIVMKAEGKNRYFGSFGKEEDAGRVAKTLAEIYNPVAVKFFK